MSNNNFYSVDKLVEFGLSMAVANQMVNSMNTALQNSYIAGAQMTSHGSQLSMQNKGVNTTSQLPPDAPQNISVVIENRTIGPLTPLEFCLLIDKKIIISSTLAWLPGMTDWKQIIDIPELLKLIASRPSIS